ncbi:Mitochondrial distribution and morphology protein 10 [Paramarasmius palmivorus]|uniref:Mitochondrial distribution and morphology protein 10 n=1 Tax=Paramarasmius palmivorus TaxID=297713 RepID=A0AAW0E8W5_9AGAR
MHPFASYVLRSYYKATGWNEDNLFTNLTRSSDAILDFTPPHGLTLNISKSPNALFKTTYSMNAMPSLNGSVGYIFTSCDLDVGSSGGVKFKDMVERFRVYDQPRRPEGKGEEWLAGERIDKRDYLMYGRMYIPTGRLDALYSTRLSPTLQAVVAAISSPPAQNANYNPLYPNAHQNAQALSIQNPNSNLMVYLQHDVGKWCTEYSWSAEDGMWGVKVLHNFGRLASSSTSGAAAPTVKERVKRVDEEDAIEGGLRGRVSAGAELYFSAREKSAGRIRFSTLPDATPPSSQVPPPSPFSPSTSDAPPVPSTSSQPPTTITALFNPMLGHLSAAYSARVSSDLSLSSRFDFNVYSYDSEWTMGAEYWLRRSRSVKREDEVSTSGEDERKMDVHGVVKARASTSNDVSIMWEGRIRNMLISLGVVSGRGQPIRAVGVELNYFSSDAES